MVILYLVFVLRYKHFYASIDILNFKVGTINCKMATARSPGRKQNRVFCFHFIIAARVV